VSWIEKVGHLWKESQVPRRPLCFSLTLLGRRLTEEDFWVYWWKTQDWWKKTLLGRIVWWWGNWDILDCDEVGLETLGSWDSIWLCLVVEGTFCGHWLHKRRVVPFRLFLFCFHPLSPSDFVTLTATPSIDKVGCNPRSGFVFSNTPLSQTCFALISCVCSWLE